METASITEAGNDKNHQPDKSGQKPLCRHRHMVSKKIQENIQKLPLGHSSAASEAHGQVGGGDTGATEHPVAELGESRPRTREQIRPDKMPKNHHRLAAHSLPTNSLKTPPCHGVPLREGGGEVELQPS